VDAYSQLVAEGYLQARRGAGTRVAADRLSVAAPEALARDQANIRHDLSPFQPALDGFPRRTWHLAMGHVLRSASNERLGYPDPAGVPELRGSLAAYLARTRGLHLSVDQVIVTGGTRQGLALAWRALLGGEGRSVAIEWPGWGGVSETATDASLATIPIPVDEEGILVENLARTRADAVAVAPAHQYPTGSVLSARRRAELVCWARQGDRLIVEDDYDAEYRYDRQPVGSLQGLEPDRVLYLGSTSKTLAPAVRVGWLVSPPRLVGALVEAQRRCGGGPSPLHQLALAHLIERGDLDRHLRAQRRRYARRRDLLLQALARELPAAEVSGAAAGLYVTVKLPQGSDVPSVLAHARTRGLAVEGFVDQGPALVLGYAILHETVVEPVVEALAACVRLAS
jgi:GntR family transcriptional regulator / MocR family aminotransferase